MAEKYVGNFRISASGIEHDFFGLIPIAFEVDKGKRPVLAVQWIQGRDFDEYSTPGLWLVYMNDTIPSIAVTRWGDSDSALPELEKSSVKIGKRVGTFSLGLGLKTDFFGFCPASTETLMRKDGPRLRVVWFQGGLTIEYLEQGTWGVYLNDEKHISVWRLGGPPVSRDVIDSTGCLDLTNPEHLAILMARN
jgi:hypothetical protein